MQSRDSLNGDWPEADLFSKVIPNEDPELPIVVAIPLCSFPHTCVLLIVTTAFLLIWHVLRLQEVACLHGHIEPTWIGLLIPLTIRILLNLFMRWCSWRGCFIRACCKWASLLFYNTHIETHCVISVFSMTPPHLFELSMSKVMWPR